MPVRYSTGERGNLAGAPSAQGYGKGYGAFAPSRVVSDEYLNSTEHNLRYAGSTECRYEGYPQD